MRSMATNTDRADMNIWTVSRLNQTVRETLQRDATFRNLWLEGEIFNLNYHSSGHIYFSLKDDQSVIRCTFFRGANQSYRHIRLTNGMQVLVQGSISVYLQRGEYQINVVRLMLAGEGELRLRIEELKKRLYAEGLFAPERKRDLPYLPLTVGIATAPTGAAIKDIIRVARKRFPQINILLAPCRVQGEGAEASIVAAIQALNDPSLNVDVIIAGRGGGSFEDLLAFNQEPVVRAFADSDVPIVSAVGHEIDHPLTDLAADVAAATPSAAAEMAIPDMEEVLDTLEDCGLRMSVALRNRYRNEKQRLERIFQSQVFVRPQSLIENQEQRLDLAYRDLKNNIANLVREGSHRLRAAVATMPILYEKNVHRHTNRFDLAAERLQNFSPLGTLSRGFSVVRNEQKNVIRSYRDTRAGDNLEILLGKGRLQVEVTETLPE
ncbi:MAG: exodeoxyribonuclease VII large subunit [Leptospiraceae bacterium]|nr:exodeoxyribonuclease VII large subunit [Leptospiraceae bacterium]MCB1316786.1 exodeoxyribonuclease VII large subunit [Leptospiraceae bacterium]MCB1323007.1 exodeoxyribonuclease VII large subunit [Leptospiraceae bacterium]